MSRLLIIGVGYEKYSGKTTLAKAMQRWLERNKATYKVSVNMIINFADPLKADVAELVAGMIEDDLPLDTDTQEYATPDTYYLRGLSYADRVKEVLRRLNGTEEEKEPYRKIMQWYGTEYRRGMFGKDYWLNRTYATIKAIEDARSPQFNGVIFVPDLRFPNEADFIKDRMEGLNVRIIREGLSNGDGHESEVALKDYLRWDHLVHNDGSKEEFVETAHRLMQLIADTSWKNS